MPDCRHPNEAATGCGDDLDANGLFSLKSSRRVPTPVLDGEVDAGDYYMLHPVRGKCLVVNNYHFEERTKLQPRRGTEKDADALTQCFTGLGFEVEQLVDGSAADIRKRLRDLSNEDHSAADCLIVCVLSHGDKGVLWGRDNRYHVDELYSHFTADRCPTLAGKPKLFFVQACQGDSFDRGTRVRINGGLDVTDSGIQYQKIPNWADLLVMYSTIPGHFSWRNPANGSWFIQALVSVLTEDSKRDDLLTMLTTVNRRVALQYESFCPGQDEFDGNKQVPCINSMLTRKVYFRPIDNV